MMTADEIRETLEAHNPDVPSPETSLKPFGFRHEHPQIAIGVVLISYCGPYSKRKCGKTFRRSKHRIKYDSSS
jgi:hypothetical protein